MKRVLTAFSPGKATKPDNRLVIGYARVSTGDRQELSVENQVNAIHGCELGGAISELIEDRESAKSLNRPGMERLMQLINAGRVRTIVVWKLDRLTRSVRDLCNLVELFERRNVALVSLNETIDTETAAGRMFVKMIALISEWERETISERTVSVLTHKKAKGERLGNVPYGYSADKNERGPDGRTVIAARLIPNEDELKVIAEIQRLRGEGVTLMGIAQRLNENGVKTRRGTDWRFQYVDRILKELEAEKGKVTA